MAMGRGVGGLVALAVLLAAPLARGADAEHEPSPYYDTGRFYFYFQTGHNFTLDDHLVADVAFDQPAGFDLVLGGGGGYNISDHWGIELQGHGTEADIRSSTGGKLQEYSNITVVPAVRFRWPLQGGRLVPFLTGGVGYAFNDVNDQSNPSIKVLAEDDTVVGSLAGGFEYFVNPNIAVGATLHSFIHPDQDIRVVVRNAGNAIVRDERGSFNQTSLALLAHVRIFPGAPGTPGNRSLRRWLFADHGPFDTDDTRVYLYAFGGHTAQFDGDFGGGLDLKDPGDFNATLGAGIGVNLDRHWGLEAQFFNVAPNINGHPYGKFTEIDNNSFLLLGRFRWPFLDGRLVPYLTAGLGAGTFDINDSRAFVDVPTDQGTAVTARTPTVSVQATSVAGEVGVGLEYFLNHHVSIGVALPVYLYPDLDTTVRYGSKPPTRGHANFSGLAPQIQIKAYLN